MTQNATQKNFLALFPLLLLCDFAAQLAITMEVAELQPLVSIWMGPLDDIFYGLCGIQALYYLLDPDGETRDEGPMSTTATVKKCVSLLGSSAEYQRRLLEGFYSGGVRSLLGLGAALLIVAGACLVTSADALSGLRLVIQAHLGYLLPVSATAVAAFSFFLGAKPRRCWTQAFLGATAVLLVSAALDGRMENYLFHLLAGMSNLQAWGATASWIGVASTFGGGRTTEVNPEAVSA